MAKLGELMVIIDADDRLTPKMGMVENSIKSTARSAASSRAALRSMAYGLSTLGTMAVGLGVALSRSNNETTKSIGNMILMAGTFLSGIGAATQLVYTIQRLTKAWKDLTTAQIIAKAFSGPIGWIGLAAGAAVAGGAMYAASQSRSTAGTTPARGTNITNINIGGNLVTERQMYENARQYSINKAAQNKTSGIK